MAGPSSPERCLAPREVVIVLGKCFFVQRPIRQSNQRTPYLFGDFSIYRYGWFRKRTITHLSAKEEFPMKKTFASLLLVALLVLVTAMPAFAGGDQVRGDNGQGDVNQHQVMDPPPFQP